MNFCSAIEALLEGKRVKRIDWPEGMWLQMDDGRNTNSYLDEIWLRHEPGADGSTQWDTIRIDDVLGYWQEVQGE